MLVLSCFLPVAFGHDDIMDPWFPLGTANPLQVAYVGALAAQLTSRNDVAECFRMITDRAAAVLGLASDYGIAAGRPANLIILPAHDQFDIIRRGVRPTHVVAHGSLIATSPPTATTLTWPGRDAELIDFVRERDRAERGVCDW